MPSHANLGVSDHLTAREASRKFHFNRHIWLGLVARDRSLSGSAYRVTILLWQRMNPKKGYAWPSQETIANELQMDKSTVKRAIKALEQRGWITVELSRGRGKSNRYRMAFGLKRPPVDHAA